LRVASLFPSASPARGRLFASRWGAHENQGGVPVSGHPTRFQRLRAVDPSLVVQKRQAVTQRPERTRSPSIRRTPANMGFTGNNDWTQTRLRGQTPHVDGGKTWDATLPSGSSRHHGVQGMIPRPGDRQRTIVGRRSGSRVRPDGGTRVRYCTLLRLQKGQKGRRRALALSRFERRQAPQTWDRAGRPPIIPGCARQRIYSRATGKGREDRKPGQFPRPRKSINGSRKLDDGNDLVPWAHQFRDSGGQ